MKHFKALVSVVETYGGVCGRKPGLVVTQLVEQGVKLENINTVDPKEITKVGEACRKCYLLCMLLHGTNNGWYFQLKTDLSNNMIKGSDNFPKMIVETMHLLTNYRSLPKLQRVRNPDDKGLVFVKGKGSTPHSLKRDSTNKDEIKCFHYGIMGHYKNVCPNLRALEEGNQNFNIDDCHKEHNLFYANNGYELVQKQEKGV